MGELCVNRVLFEEDPAGLLILLVDISSSPRTLIRSFFLLSMINLGYCPEHNTQNIILKILLQSFIFQCKFDFFLHPGLSYV